MSRFVIDMATLRHAAEEVELAVSATDVGLPPDQWAGEVRGVFQVEKLGEQVSVRGRLEAVTRLECVRCLRAFETPLEVPFEVFAEHSGRGNRADEEELERDYDLVFFNGRQLDLGDQARETLIVERPMNPRCREDCRGLCPGCGADLNEVACTCASKS